MFVAGLYMVYSPIIRKEKRMGSIIITIDGTHDIPGSKIDKDGPTMTIFNQTFFQKANTKQMTWVTWFKQGEDPWTFLNSLSTAGIGFNLSYNKED